MSDPQLRKDIASLTLKLAEAKKRILELESAPPKTIDKVVIKEVVKVEPRDKSNEDALASEVVRLKELLASKPRVEIKEVRGPVEIKRVEVPVVKEVPAPYPVTKEVIKYVKCPKQAALIRELQAKIGGK